jgi:hypothetical protein
MGAKKMIASISSKYGTHAAVHEVMRQPISTYHVELHTSLKPMSEPMTITIAKQKDRLVICARRRQTLAKLD